MHPHQEFILHPYNMYYASMRDTSHYQNWNWESNYYEHYGQSDQHLHYLSNFNRDREHSSYSTYSEKHFIRVEQPKIDFDRTEEWRTGNANHPPIPKLKIRTISANEMTGLTRGSRGGSRGSRARNYTNVSISSSSRGRGRGGTYNRLSGVLNEEHRGRGRPRGRPRSSGSQKRTQTQSISQNLSVESSKSKKDILDTIETSKTDIRKENTNLPNPIESIKHLPNPIESIKHSTISSSDPSSSLQSKIDTAQCRAKSGFTKPNVLCINLKDYGIDVSQSDTLLHRKFPNMFTKKLQIVLKRLESEQTSPKPNKNVILHPCIPTCSKTSPTSLTSQKSLFQEPPVADSADELNIAATTVIGTAAKISTDIVTHTTDSNLTSKKTSEVPSISPSKNNSLLSEPPHKITALDISKLKSKLKNVKYPECFAAETQTDYTLIENTNANIISTDKSESHVLEPSSSEAKLKLSSEEKDTGTQTFSFSEQEASLSSSSLIVTPEDEIRKAETVNIASDSLPLEIEKAENSDSKTNSVPLDVQAIDMTISSNDLSNVPKTPESNFISEDKCTTLAASEINDNNCDKLDTTEECKTAEKGILSNDTCDNKSKNDGSECQMPDNTSDLCRAVHDIDNTFKIERSSVGNSGRDETKEKEIAGLRDLEALHTEDQNVKQTEVNIGIGINKIIDAAHITSVAAGFTVVECTSLIDNEKQRSAIRHKNANSVLTTSHLPSTEVNYDSDATVRYSDDEEGNLEIDLGNGDMADARKIPDVKNNSNTVKGCNGESSTSGGSHMTLPVEDDKSKNNSKEDEVSSQSEGKVEEIDTLLTADNVEDVKTSSPMNEKANDTSLSVSENTGVCKEEKTDDIEIKKSPGNSKGNQVPSNKKRVYRKRKTTIEKDKEVEELTLFITTSPQKSSARRRGRAPVKLESTLAKEAVSSKAKSTKTQRKRTSSFSKKKQTVKQRKRPIKQEFDAKDYLSQIKDTLNSKGAKQTTEDEEDDDLPTILPPKRRRRISSSTNRKGSESQEGGMERLYQEFPRHNWLENKYKEEGIAQENLFEMELNSLKTETINKTALKKHKMKDKKRKNVAVTEKDKLKSENVTMDMEVSTTTIDDLRSDEKKDKQLTYSDESTLQIDLHASARDLETPDSTPNRSMEASVDKIGEENGKTVQIQEENDDSHSTKTKSTSDSEPTPLDLCVKQGKDVVSNLKTSSGDALSATDYSDSCKETSAYKDASSEKRPCVKDSTIKDSDYQQIAKESVIITDHRENDVSEERVPVVHHRETKSAPLVTDDKAVTLTRDSHSFPSFHYSTCMPSERKRTELNVKTPENSIFVSLLSTSSTDSIKTTTSQSVNECLDLSNYVNKSQNLSAASQAPPEENVFQQPRNQEKPPEYDSDYIKHLKEFREMEKAEAKMAKEREELLRLKHEKAELLKQLGNQCQRNASNGGHIDTRSTMSSPNHLNTTKCESRKLLKSNQVQSANSRQTQEKINLAHLKQQQLMKLRDFQHKRIFSDNKTQNPPPAHTKQKENFLTLINRMEKGKIQMPSAIEASCPFRKRKQPVLDPHFETRILSVSSRKIQKAHSQSPFQSAGSLIYPLPSFVEQKSKLCNQSSEIKNNFNGMNRSSSAPSIHTAIVSHQDRVERETSNSTVISPINQTNKPVHNQNQGNLENPHTAKLQMENSGSPIKIQGNAHVEDLSPSRKSLTETVPKETEREIQKELNAAVARRQRPDRMVNANTDGTDLSRYHSEVPQRQPERRDMGVNNIINNGPITPKSHTHHLTTNTSQMQNHPMPIPFPRHLHPHFRAQTLGPSKNVNPSVQSQLANRLKCPVTTNSSYNTAIPAEQQQFHPHQQFPPPHPQTQGHPLRQNHYVSQNPNVTSSQRVLVGAKTIPNVVSNGQTHYIQQTHMQSVSDRNVNMYEKRNPNNIPVRKTPYNVKSGMRYPIQNTHQATPVRGPPPVYSMQSNAGETAPNYPQMQTAKMHRMRYIGPSQQSMDMVNSKQVIQGQINTDVMHQGNFGIVQNGQFPNAGRSENSVPELVQSNIQQQVNHPPYLIPSQPTHNVQTQVMMSKENPSQGQYVQRTAAPTSAMTPNSHTASGTAMKHMGSPTGNLVAGPIPIAPATVMTSPVNGTVGNQQILPGQTPGIPIASPVIPMQTNVATNVAPPQLQHVNGSCVVCGKFAMFLCSSCQKIWYCSQTCQLNHWVAHAQECKTFTSDGSAGMT